MMQHVFQGEDEDEDRVFACGFFAQSLTSVLCWFEVGFDAVVGWSAVGCPASTLALHKERHLGLWKVLAI